MGTTKPYIVRQGDHVARIAAEIGCSEDDIWEHDKNLPLRDRERTRDILFPGDVLHVHDLGAQPVALQLQQANAFTADVPTVSVQVKFFRDGAPLAGERFVATGVGWTQEGTSASDGLVSLSVPVFLATVSLLYLRTGETHELKVGHLDPITEPSGIAQRLELVGCLSPFRERSAEEITGALMVFQCLESLSVSGELDDPTRARLKERVGA